MSRCWKQQNHSFRAVKRSWDTPLPEPGPCESFPRVLRIECDRCGETVIHNETHMPERQRGMVLRVLLSRMRHDGCGGLAGKAELITGVEGASSRPVRRIVLVVDE